MTPRKKRQVLVTGGAGFLGTNLCRRLLQDGCRVLCIDNFQTGRRDNIEDLIGHPRFQLLEADIAQGIPADTVVDEIYNLACPASPVHYQKSPIKTLLTCTQGAGVVLDLARRRGARIFQSSTSEVYGDPQVHPQPEAYRGHVDPVGPRACYDEGKRCAEALFFSYRQQFGTSIKVGRIFNTYGPYMDPDDGRVVSNFIVQALQNKPITIYGDGTQTRSFCYVDDLIELMGRFMASDEAFIGPLNMGNDTERSVLEIADLVLELTGSASKIVTRPLPIDDPVRRCPDISLAKRRLRWKPRVSLPDGLVKTIVYFDKVLSTGKQAPRSTAISVWPTPALGTTALFREGIDD